MRIGVVDLQMAGWPAGAVVSRTMAFALHAAGADTCLLSNTTAKSPFPVVPLPLPKYFPGEWTLRNVARLGEKSSLLQTARTAGVDVLLPLVTPLEGSPPRKIGWIPDMQHRHLPELFPKRELQILDQRFQALAKKSDRLVFSSRDSRADFLRAFPAFESKVRVASFPSLFTFECPPPSSEDVVKKYHLPPRFLLVINQFWQHKNHCIVPKALAILRERGLRIPVVMAGVPADHRDRQNSALSNTLQASATGGVWEQCFVLGKISSEEIHAFLRSATALIQPSRFEGWNTTIQDAKALGCPHIVSDLPVHREQCPDAVGFFPPDKPETLADILQAKWDTLPSRPDAELERASLAKETAFATSYGHQLKEICSELAP